MLDPLSTWKDRLLQMKPTSTPIDGVTNLANFLNEMMNKVQAIGGHQGIFTFNKALFLATLTPTLVPTGSASVWSAAVATAWQTAVAASIITPATVSNPAWLISSVDIMTLPIGASTIVTLSAASMSLKSALASSQSTFSGNVSSGQEAFAKAFRDATLMFQFLCIGIGGTPISPVPIPLPLGAQ